MQPEQEYTGSKVLRDWENKVGPGHKLSLSEASELAERVGCEFCKCEPLERMLGNLENETSFPQIFGEAVDAFCVFCRKMKAVMLWPVKLPRLRARKRLLL